MRITSSIRSLLCAVVLLALSAAAFGQIGIAISFGPPELPIYEQPLCPGNGYLWTPGYWAYANDYDDYYWVPGTWVMPPQVGYLWTPAYWGWGGNGFFFYEGYWGPQVGFYGGINYGYGYFGDGYQGGRWQGSQFYYNRSVSNVNVTNIHNVYNTTVINTTVNRISYNGGNGGINRRPTPEEEAVVREKHIPAVAAQAQHMQAARAMPDLRASVNHGAPPIAATPRPGALNDREVVRARPTGTPYNRPMNRAAGQSGVNTPAPRPETNEGRPVRPTLNNPPESSRPEPTQPTRRQPNSLPDPTVPNREPAMQPNHQPESNRPEPTPRPQATPPNEARRPERTPPPLAEAQRAPQEHRQQEARTPDEKHHQAEPPKKEERPPE